MSKFPVFPFDFTDTFLHYSYPINLYKKASPQIEDYQLILDLITLFQKGIN